MMRRGLEVVSTIAALLILVILCLLSSMVLMEGFPLLEYAPSTTFRRMIPAQSFEELSQGVSRFLWESRALDVTAQAFVIVVAIICCLALLKPEVEG